MLALIGGLRGILAAIGGAAVMFAALGAWDALIDDPRVRSAGMAEERILWEEARRKLLAQLEEERRTAQAEIDRVERDYLDQRDRDRASIQSLEDIITQMEAEDAANPDPGARLLFPERLSKSIDAIGR